MEGAFYATYPDADKALYSSLFQRLKAIDISTTVAEDIVNEYILRKKALKLSETAFLVSQGQREFSELDKLLQDVPEKSVGLPLEETSNDLEKLVEGKINEQGLRWRLDCLNKSLGSLRKGDFGFIFARPETGKTTFLASEITSFLTCGTREGILPSIIWFNNEEDGWKVMLRIYCAYFGVDSATILSNVKKFRDAFVKDVGARFRLYDSATISRSDVERIVSSLNPSLVIYDQIDKIKGFSSDREDLRLGSIYQWARELAKGSHAAIGVCQADGHGEGVRYLSMEHVANAKTAKQAEADFILGIGRASDPELATARFLNISKNKLLGDKDSIPDLRHGRFEVLIKADVARYEDVIRFD